MNKVYLLLSFFIFVLIVFFSYDASEVKSYVDGNVMLKVYCDSDGTILKREYYVNGVLSRVLEYREAMISVERIYDEQGKKIVVNHFDNNQLVKSKNYSKGFFPTASGNQELGVVV